MTTSSIVPATVRPGTAWRTGFIAAGVAAAVNAALYLATHAAGVPYEVTVPGQGTVQQLPVAVLAVVSFAAVVAGTAALWLLARVRRGVTIWTMLVVLVYLASLANPVTGAKETATIACLIAAHTLVAAALIGPGRAARRR